MANKYAQIAFTKKVKEQQVLHGSRDIYQKQQLGVKRNKQLTTKEIEFIQARDSFYIATVSETNWPYIQHRGGQIGFVKIIDNCRLRFADFSGNRQYITTGNLTHNNKVSLFFMDYANQRRLKLFGEMSLITEQNTLYGCEKPRNPAPLERAFVINVAAYDWNCPKHITPRFSLAEIQQLLG